MLDPGRSWSVELPAAMVINVGATIDETGVYFGSWGLLRRDGSDPRTWDKSDGKVFGLAIEDDVPSAVGSINSPALDTTGRIYFGVRGRYDPPVNGHIFAVSFDEAEFRFERIWSQQLEGYIEWSHPAIGPDGGIYVATSVNENHGAIRGATHEAGTVPEGSSPRFYALKGPADVASESGPEVPGDWSILATYPNPADGFISVSVELPGPDFLEAQIVDVLGRIFHLERRHLNGGLQTVSWTLPPLSSGVYLLRVTPPSGQEHTTSFLHF